MSGGNLSGITFIPWLLRSNHGIRNIIPNHAKQNFLNRGIMIEVLS